MDTANKVCLIVFLLIMAGMAYADPTYDPMGENNRAMQRQLENQQLCQQIQRDRQQDEGEYAPAPAPKVCPNESSFATGNDD